MLSSSRLMPIPGALPEEFAPFNGPSAAIADGPAAAARPAVAAPRNLSASRRLKAAACFVFSLFAWFSALILLRLLSDAWLCLPYGSIQPCCPNLVLSCLAVSFAVALARPSILLLLASPYALILPLTMSPAGLAVAMISTTPNAAAGLLPPPASTVPEPSFSSLLMV